MEGQVLFHQHHDRAHDADGLCRHSGDGRTGGVQMEAGHQHQVADDVHDAGHQHEDEGRFAVAQTAEYGRQHVIGHNEEDACAADADIACRQLDGLRRGLHQDGDAPGKAHQYHEQRRRDDGKYHGTAADDLPDVLGPLFAQIPGDEDGDAHCKLSHHEGHEVQHLTAGGDGREARGGAKMADHQQVYCAVGGLQHQCAQNGKHEEGQLFRDAALREIRLIAFQENFSFRT